MPESTVAPLRAWLGRCYRAGLARARGLRALPIARWQRAAQLRRLTPLADGRQRGEPVIRYYWERFLDRHRHDLSGRCLEVGSTQAIERHGGPGVGVAEAIDLTARDGISVVADLSRADGIAEGSYDCFIVPFTMHLIYDVDAALYHAIRILKPGGVLLANFPCVDYYFPHGLDMGTGRPLFVFWWFTPIQVENLLRRAGLGPSDFDLVADGNLFARVAYQMNLPAEELSATERDHRDAGHPLVLSVRIVKPAGWQCARPIYRDPWLPDVTPAHWHPVTGHYPRP